MSQCEAVAGLQLQPLESLRGTFGQFLGKVNCLLEVRDGLWIGKMLQRSLPCLAPPLDSTLGLSRFLCVVGQYLWLSVDDFRFNFLDCFGDTLVQAPSVATQKTAVSGVAHQRV